MIFANAGLPMIALAWPWALFLIVPIVGIETWASRKSSCGLAARFRSICLANIVSTIVGWPLAWSIMVILQLYVIPGGGGSYGLSTPLGVLASVTIQAAWLLPYEQELYWMIPVAGAFLMVPFFLVSVLIEGAIHRFGLSNVSNAERWRLTWTSNLWSYGFLIFFFVSLLVYSVVNHVPK